MKEHNPGIPSFKWTCSLDNPLRNSITFALNSFYVQKALQCELPLEVFIPSEFPIPSSSFIRWFPSDDPFYDFVKIHNKINEGKSHRALEIHPSSFISKNAVIGNQGMRYIKREGEVISIFHTGNVIIRRGVTIGEFSSIARAVFDSTVIDEYVKIGSGVHIGHNCQIGKRTIIIDGAVVLGSVKIGDDCYMGGNSTIRNGISISPKTFIAMGAVVTKSIESPGWIHAGIPAKPLKEWDGEWT